MKGWLPMTTHKNENVLFNPMNFWKEMNTHVIEQTKRMEKEMKEWNDKTIENLKTNEATKPFFTGDPTVFWKEVYNQMEKHMGSKLEETMKKEEFAKLMGDTLNLNLIQQKWVQTNTEQWFKQLHIPTLEDLASVSTLIINVEEKVEKTEELMEESIEDVKKDIQRLEGKLDQLLTLLVKK